MKCIFPHTRISIYFYCCPNSWQTLCHAKWYPNIIAYIIALQYQVVIGNIYNLTFHICIHISTSLFPIVDVYDYINKFNRFVACRHRDICVSYNIITQLVQKRKEKKKRMFSLSPFCIFD